MSQRIVHHEDIQHVSFRDFIAGYWARKAWGALPPYSAIKGRLAATVNHGRWVVECPSGCGFAVIGSQTEPFFICPNCGSAENGGQWYNVSYPHAKQAIENVLLKRPARDETAASTRNWLITETVADLERENHAHGI